MVDQLSLAVKTPWASLHRALECSFVQMTTHVVAKILPRQKLLFAYLALKGTDVLVTLHMHFHIKTELSTVVALLAGFEVYMRAAVFASDRIPGNVVFPRE